MGSKLDETCANKVPFLNNMGICSALDRRRSILKLPVDYATLKDRLHCEPKSAA